MRLFFPWFLVVSGLLGFVAVADAHHSFSAVYDASRTISITGAVTQFRFVNPHAMMFMDVPDEAGTVAKWTVELAGRLNLSEGGWTAESIKSGERVTVTGNPTHADSTRMFFRRLVRADGTELLPAAEQRLNSIEQERRERARQRNQQK